MEERGEGEERVPQVNEAKIHLIVTQAKNFKQKNKKL